MQLALPNLHAFLPEQLTTSIRVADEQHATEVHDWKQVTCIDERTCLSINVHDDEWLDEHIDIQPEDILVEIEHAQDIDWESLAYETFDINVPDIVHLLNTDAALKQKVVADDEHAQDLLVDLRHEQSNLKLDPLPILEKPVQSSIVQTLNYPDQHYPDQWTLLLSIYEQLERQSAHMQISHSLSIVPCLPLQRTRPIFHVQQQDMHSMHDENYSSLPTVQSNHVDTFPFPSQWLDSSPYSESSSLLDMELFLNHFEESLDHEQRLPLIDQISLSYGTSMLERYEPVHRALPVEWLPALVPSHDEQLVEQWTVDNNLDTIQQVGTIRLPHLLLDEPLPTTGHAAACIDEELTRTDTDEYNHLTHLISHCSPTSDYETDSLDKDNDTTSTTTDLIVTVTSTTNILPSTSFANTTFLSQSSPPLTSYTAPAIPIVYFLDALAVESKERNTLTQDFLLTLGFGQHELSNPMNELNTTIATSDPPLKANLVDGPTHGEEILATTVHDEQQNMQYAVENRLDDDDRAYLIYPNCLKHGQGLDEFIQGPLSTFYEPVHLHLAVVNEVSTYQMSIHHDYSLFQPASALTHLQHSSNELISLADYQMKGKDILSKTSSHESIGSADSPPPMLFPLDPPMCIDHYRIESFRYFPQTFVAKISPPPVVFEHQCEPLPDVVGEVMLASRRPMRTNASSLTHAHNARPFVPFSIHFLHVKQAIECHANCNSRSF